MQTITEQLTYSVDFANRTISFNRKPGESVRACLKTAGMRWSPGAGLWYCPRGSHLPEKIQKYVDQENGYRRPDGACWECKTPEGFFRAYGAATPVYCDACYAKHEAKRAAGVMAD